MEAGKRTVNEIFTGTRILEIPFFQRAYVWGEDQWKRLLEDVETVCKARKSYFMGAVILKQQPTSSGCPVGDVRTIIDGQQRLTTISILLKVLSLKTNSSKKFYKRFELDDDSPVLKHNWNDNETYKAIMSLQTLENTDKKDKISCAYQFFADHIDTDKLDFDDICNYITFVGIDLGAEEDEQQIFDTINSLGVRLTTAELLKNYFFSRTEIDEYKTYWRDVFEKDDETRAYWDQKLTTGRMERALIDLFFYAFLQIKVQSGKKDNPSEDAENPAENKTISSEDKTKLSKVENLFASYKLFISKYLNDSKLSLMQEIKEYAEVFRNTIHPDALEKELPKQSEIDRINMLMFALDTTTLIPYVLFIEYNVQDTEQKNELYSYIETYIMRRLVTRQTTKNYNQLFTDRLILNRVLSKDAFVEYLTGQEDKVNRMPADDELVDAFYNSVLINRYALGVLYLIESKIRDQSKYSTTLLGIKKYSLEHIMPKKWRNNWRPFEGDEAERDRHLLTLGNLTIITQTLNASIRDAEWKTKKTGKDNKYGLLKYANGIEIFSEYLDLDVWDENSIKMRASELANYALDVWKI